LHNFTSGAMQSCPFTLSSVMTMSPSLCRVLGADAFGSAQHLSSGRELTAR
jgi:hypothetical protein